MAAKRRRAAPAPAPVMAVMSNIPARREGWIKAGMALALGYADPVPVPVPVPDPLCWLTDVRISVAGGREGMPMSCGSLYASLAARFLPLASVDPRKCDVLLPAQPCREIVDATAFSDGAGGTRVVVAAESALDHDRFRADFDDSTGVFVVEWSYPETAGAPDGAQDGALQPVHTATYPSAVFPVTHPAAPAAPPCLGILDAAAGVKIVPRRVGWRASLALENPRALLSWPDDGGDAAPFTYPAGVASSTRSGLIAVIVHRLGGIATSCPRVVVYRASDGRIVRLLASAADIVAAGGLPAANAAAMESNILAAKLFSSVCFLPDGVHVALADSCRVYIFHAVTGAYVRTIDVARALCDAGARAPHPRVCREDIIAPFAGALACTDARELCVLPYHHQAVYVIDVETCGLVATLKVPAAAQERAAAAQERAAAVSGVEQVLTHGSSVFGVSAAGAVFVWPRS
jgi:hypothetical protein